MEGLGFGGLGGSSGSLLEHENAFEQVFEAQRPSLSDENTAITQPLRIHSPVSLPIPRIEPGLFRSLSAPLLRGIETVKISPVEPRAEFHAQKLSPGLFSLDRASVMAWMSAEGPFQSTLSEQEALLRANVLMRLRDDVNPDILASQERFLCCLPVNKPSDVNQFFSCLSQLFRFHVNKNDGNSLFTQAFRLGFDAVFDVLDSANNQCLLTDSKQAAHTALNIRGKRGLSLAHYGCFLSNSIERLLLLFEVGVDFTLPASGKFQGRLPIEFAFAAGHMESVFVLLNQYPDQIQSLIKQQNSQGFALAHYLAVAGECDLLRQVISLEGVIDRPAKDGQTPLLLAIRAGHTSIALSLIEAGVDCAQVHNECTPAHIAAMMGDMAVLEKIRNKNPSLLHMTTAYGLPLHLAKQWRKFEALEFLTVSGLCT